MDSQSIFSNFIIIIDIFILITFLLSIIQGGKLIIKPDTSKGWTIALVVFLILYTLLPITGKISITILNSNHKTSFILVIIMTIILSLREKEVRDNGIYHHLYLYKWRSIKSYSWISENTIQFDTGANMLSDGKFEININDDSKSKMNELLKEHISL